MSVEMSLDIDNVEEFRAKMQRLDSAMQRHVHRNLVSLAADIKALARQLVPVVTGYLRSTIFAKVTEWILKVGATAQYAVYVEGGTRYMEARRFLSRSIETHLPRLISIINRAVEDSITEAST